jgi:hypothetical protein
MNAKRQSVIGGPGLPRPPEGPRTDDLFNDDTGEEQRACDSNFWTWQAPVCMIQTAQIK